MGPELLEIQPQELKFTFELKKQSTCSVHLVNNLDQYVAFKVKTTSPKRYCVRPNIGIVQPRSTCDFTVTMQAQKVAPPDMQCKDKFLVQSTIVPFGTTEEDITPGMFAKDNGKYIEENKLRVILISPPHSPVLPPINGTPKQEPAYEAPVLKDQALSGMENNLLPHTVVNDAEELKLSKDVQEFKVAKGVQELKLAKDVQEMKLSEDVQDLKLPKDVQGLKLPEYLQELKPTEDVKDLKPAEDVHDLKLDDDVQELKLANDVNELKPAAKDMRELKLADIKQEMEPSQNHGLKLAKDVHELKLSHITQETKLAEDHDLKLAKDIPDSKLHQDVENLRLVKDVEKLEFATDVENHVRELESKLSEAEITITRLREETSIIIEEKQKLKQELTMLRMKNGVPKVQKGFPSLFVLMIALVSLFLGYKLHS